MAGTVNLIELIQTHLTPDVIGRMSSVLGESTDKTRTGLTAAVPALLSGLDKTASTSGGARRITTAIENTDEKMLDSPTPIFGKGLPTEGAGSGILNSILGSEGVSNLVESIGSVSGLSGKGTLSMLGLLTPVVLGVIKKAMRMLGADRFDIPSLLASQRSNIAAAMPQGMVEETYAGPRVARARAPETYTTPRTTHTGTNWLLPLALLAGVLGLMWWLSGRTRETALVPRTTVHAGNEEGARTGTTLSLNDLKNKYSSVFEEARSQGVQISDLREQDGKLVIRGTAPSQEAANRVWEAIKRVNPSLNDVMADIKVSPKAPTVALPSETTP
jgi:hypothetical protein